MTDETPTRIAYDASNNDSLFVSSDQIGPNIVRLDPPPIFAIRGANGQTTVTVHHDGRLEYGPDYQPDEAARLFWEAVEQQARSIQYGAPLNARINEHLKAGQEAEQAIARVEQVCHDLPYEYARLILDALENAESGV